MKTLSEFKKELQGEQLEHLTHLYPHSLEPWKRNARKHSKKQLKQIAESIRTFGFTTLS